MISAPATRFARFAAFSTALLWAALSLQPIVAAVSNPANGRGAPLDPETGRTLAPPPAWVVGDEETLPIPDTEPSEDTGDGLRWLLVDDRYDAATRTRYFRRALEITSSDGLGYASNVEVSFDPTWATLAWHSLTVTRSGRTESRLDPEAIEVSRRHDEMDWAVYDASVTAMILLDDVRVGDVVEYAYSIVGANPVFGGRVAEYAFLQWGVPVDRVRRDVRMPLDRSLDVREWAGAPAAISSETDGVRVWSWRMDDVPASENDYDAPPEWDTRARMQASEYRDWGEVVEWALPLYPRIEDTSALAAELARAALGADAPLPAAEDHDTAEQCVRFVQEQIRYLSVAVGESSHRPSAPSDTLARRFGDCKDKAWLLAAALEAFGIRAVPALVNTGWCGGIEDMLPSPNVFDHVIVRLEFPDGRVRWIDATSTHQGGPLDARGIRGYGLALPLASGVNALERVVPAAESRDRTSVRERFVSDAFDAPALLSVETVYRGAAADRMRARLATTSRADLSRSFLQYYAQNYPEIEETAAFAVDDRRAENVLTLTEAYRITAFWERVDASSPYRAMVYPDAVSDEMQRPSKTMRRSPYRLSHPVHIEQETELKLPEGWDDPAERSAIENPWFVLRMSSTGTKDGFTYRTSYESRASRVDAAAVPAYARDVDRALKEMGWELTYQPSRLGSSGSKQERVMVEPGQYSPVAMGAGAFVVACWFTVFLLFARNRRGPPALPPGPGPVGLGGWLAVLFVGLLARTVLTSVNLVAAAPLYLQEGVLQNATGGVTGVGLAALRVVAWTGGVLVVGVVVNGLVSIVLFLGRRRATRRVLIAGFVVAVLGAVADFVFGVVLLAVNETDDYRKAAVTAGVSFVAAVLFAVVWITYLALSKRVANTFRR
jgi:transglutaminase-like putative cysteine protease